MRLTAAGRGHFESATRAQREVEDALFAGLDEGQLRQLRSALVALRHNLDLNINMLGRWAVWPTMSALFFAMVTDAAWPEWLLYFGRAAQDRRGLLRRRPAAEPST